MKWPGRVWVPSPNDESQKCGLSLSAHALARLQYRLDSIFWLTERKVGRFKRHTRCAPLNGIVFAMKVGETTFRK
jgi:hypothetical protein